MTTYEKQLDAKLARRGRCECGHMAYGHWHGGPIKDLEIQNCGQCKCKRFVRRATLIVEPKRKGPSVAGKRKIRPVIVVNGEAPP